MRIEKQIAKILTEKQKTLSMAESCTGGLVAHRLTNIPGSSTYFMGGIIAYANRIKKRNLKVPPRILNQEGAVSARVARLMAQNCRSFFRTDFSIGITGIAGPTGATPKKPIGLTFIAISSRKQTLCKKYIFKGSRLAVKKKAVDKALLLLLKILKK